MGDIQSKQEKQEVCTYYDKKRDISSISTTGSKINVGNIEHLDSEI